jgi:chromosome segregation ATPase
MTTETIAALVLGALALFTYVVKALADNSREEAKAKTLVLSTGAEREKLAALVAADLARAVAAQLQSLSDEVKRLTLKLDATEEKLDIANDKIDAIQDELTEQRTESKGYADGLLSRIADLRAGIVKDGDRATLDAVLDKDDKAK